MSRLPWLASAIGFAIASVVVPANAALGHQILAEYLLPANPQLAALTLGPDGKMWVAGYEQISRVTSAGKVTTVTTGALGDSIGVGPDKTLWFGAVGLNDLGHITTAGAVSYVAIPPPPGSTTIPTILGVVTGPDGNLWMTDYGNAEVIRLNADGTIAYIPLGAGSYPYGITNGPDGALWVADRAGRVERVTTAGAVTTVSLPGAIGTQSITTGGDNNLWVNAGATIDRVTPQGQVTSFPIPTSGGSTGNVQFVSADRSGNIWFTAWFAYPDEQAGIMNLSGQAKLVPALSTGSGAYAVSQGPANTMWFTEVFSHQVAKAR